MTTLNIKNQLRAGYAGLYLLTHEEQRAEALLKRTVDELTAEDAKKPAPKNEPWNLHCWSITDGRFDVADGQRFTMPDPSSNEQVPEDELTVLDAIKEIPQKSLLVLKDFHLFLKEPNAVYYRKLKDAILLARTQSKSVVILAPVLALPEELEKLFTVIDLPLPDKELLHEVLNGICESADIKPPKGDKLTAVLAAAGGLTTNEAADAFALSVIETGKVDSVTIYRQKAETLKKNGILEVVETDVTLASIGGYELAKGWLIERKGAFSAAAEAYKLPPSKGLLAIGPPGCAKSLLAKASASVFGVILLKLDAGRIFGGTVGESEANLRHAFKVAEAASPCVLWFDELDKGFSKGKGESDGGTQRRVFGSMLNWLQEKTNPNHPARKVFIVATANVMSDIEDSLISRFDVTFFCDLPNESERPDVFAIQIAKWDRDPKDFDLGLLANMTADYSGREIENIFNAVLFAAFADEGREPTMQDFINVMQHFKPVAHMMEAEIKKIRDWAKGRVRPASAPEAPVAKVVKRRLAA